MRMSVRGPSAGPVRTTLWSSGRRSKGNVGAVIALPFALILLWQSIATSRVLDVIIGVIVLICIGGKYAERVELRRQQGGE